MFFSIRRRNRAKENQKKLEREMNLAKEILSLEGQNEIIKEQMKLMEVVQKKLVKAEIKGLRQGLKSSMPALIKGREEMGTKQISTYLESVRSRAIPPSK